MQASTTLMGESHQLLHSVVVEVTSCGLSHPYSTGLACTSKMPSHGLVFHSAGGPWGLMCFSGGERGFLWACTIFGGCDNFMEAELLPLGRECSHLWHCRRLAYHTKHVCVCARLLLLPHTVMLATV